MRIFLPIVTTLLVTSLFSQKLEVEGSIIIKNSEDPTPEPGTIRWTGTDFQGWNGIKWVSLTSGITYAGEVSDADGHLYPTVIIGTQEWMAENLRTTKYMNETVIPNVVDNTNWQNSNYGAWCWYDNDIVYEQQYGKLYNWYAVNDGRGLCPAGWHIPSTSEWSILRDFLGGEGAAGGHLKESGTANWNFPNTGASNLTGFSALPGGHRYIDGSFLNFRNRGFWWSSTLGGPLPDNASARLMLYNSDDLVSFGDDKRLGLSVRCLRD